MDIALDSYFCPVIPVFRSMTISLVDGNVITNAQRVFISRQRPRINSKRLNRMKDMSLEAIQCLNDRNPLAVTKGLPRK